MKNVILLVAVCALVACARKVQYLQAETIVEETSAAERPADGHDICKESINYAPDIDNPDHTPMRYIKINVHFIGDDKGNLNFSGPEAKRFAERMVRVANYKLSLNDEMALPAGNSTPKLPVRYRYVLTGKTGDPGDDGIYVHRDSELMQFNKKGRPHHSAEKAQYDTYGVMKEEVLNVFMLEHHPDSVASDSYKPSSDGIGMKYWVKMAGTYLKYQRAIMKKKADPFEETIGVTAGLLNHEIGHSMGLRHTWRSDDGCDDTPKNSNCWKGKGCSNNMMDYNATQSAVTPCQLGKIEYNFSKENSSMRKLLRKDWCEKDPDAMVRITKGQRITWDSAKDLTGDLVIEKHGVLRVNCLLSMPEDSYIKIMSGGQLVLDGCTVTNRCGGEWNGIVTPVKRGQAKGVVIHKNNPVIENVAERKYLKRGK